jgi:hypothetical protein
MKDLYGDYENEEILKLLQEYQRDTMKFVKVLRLSTSKSKLNQQKLPIYIVQASPDSEINEIFNIRHIDNNKIRWEKLKKQEYSQCTKCQRFGHSSINCFMKPRCVKCGKEHLAKDCDINKESPKEDLHCVLCDSRGHPASYRNCQIHLKKQELIKAKKEMQVNKQVKKITSNSVNSFVTKNVSYANVAKQNMSINTLNNNNTCSQLTFQEVQNQLNNITQILGQLDKNFAMLCEANKNMQKQLQNDSERIDFLYSQFYD